MTDKQPEPMYLISESKLKRLEQHGYDFKLAKEMRSNPYHPTPEPSSEPSWITVKDGSDRDWRLISMYELRKLEHAINEECVGKNDGCPPGHLKEMHDSGNEVINKCRSRQYHPAPELTDCPHHCSVFYDGNDKTKPMEHHCDFLTETCEIEEDKIRQSEREKAFEELKDDLKTRFIASSNQWSKGRNSGLIECCNIIKESLRKVENQ